MPIYVYNCDCCGQTFQTRQPISAAPLVDCPECEGHVHRVIQPVGVVFKGSGFYVTDHRKRASSSDTAETKSEAGKAKEGAGAAAAPAKSTGGSESDS